MKKLLAALVVASIAPALSFAQLALQPAAIVKLYKTEPITVKQLKDEVQKYEAQAKRPLTVAERRQLLDVMINERLVLQAAERDGVQVPASNVNDAVENLRKQLSAQMSKQESARQQKQVDVAATDADLSKALLAQTGMDLDAYKANLKKQLTIQRYLYTVKKSEFESVKPVTDAEIQARYDLEKAKLIRPDTLRFSMIFVPKGESAEEQAKDRALAESMAKELAAAPQKFDEYVVRAQAPGSGYQGGDGGYLPRTAEAAKVVGSDFMNTLFSLKPGEVSRLMDNPRGYQIAKVTETYQQKTLDLNDPYQLGQKGTVKEYLAAMMNQERQQATIDKATAELLADLRKGNSFQVFDKALEW